MNKLKVEYLEGVPEFVVGLVEKVYSSKDRHFHTCDHLNDILEQINEQTLDDTTKRILTYSTLFHDILYEPWNPKGKDGKTISDEEVSAAYFVSVWEDEADFGQEMRKHISADEAIKIKNVILQTKDHSGTDPISMLFNVFDTRIMSSTDMGELIDYEYKIFKEYSFTRLDIYIKSRCEFILKYAEKNPTLLKLVEYIQKRNYNIAFYPGSFNPFHVGHLDVLEKAEQIFDKVIIVRGFNSEKERNDYGNIYAVKELQKREVIELYGNIISQMFGNGGIGSIYAKYNPVLIRGVRNSYDLMYEDNYLRFCKEIHPELRTSIILCDSNYSHISSSSLRGLAKLEDGKSRNIYEKYVVK